MPSDEGKALATALLASYPGSYVTEMHVLATADTLDRIGLDIAAEVVDQARLDFVKPPSSAQLHELAREMRAEATQVEPIAALPEGEVLASMPEDVREKVKRMQASWAVEDEDSETERNEEWKQRTHAIIHGPRLPGVCDGAGKGVVEIDGKLACPDCGIEVPDFVHRIPAKKRSEETA